MSYIRLAYRPIALATLLAVSTQHVFSQTQPVLPQGAAGGFGEHLRAAPAARNATVTNRPFAPIAKQAEDSSIAEIDMFVGESRVFPTPGVARIAVGNGNILTAAALDGKEVILFANAVGTSSLFVWNEAGQYQRVKINIVPGDTGRFAREIAAFLTAIPRARASVIGDKVIVEGDRLTDVDIARIDMLAKRYPQIVNFTNPLGFERMVMMDVKVAEFPVSELRELGLKWGAVGGATIGGIWSPSRRGNAPGLQVNINADNAPIASSDPNVRLALPAGLNVLTGVNLGLSATLQALAQEGKTAILAEPQLSARSGSKASFLAGGEIPYSVSSDNGTTIVFKPYGVKLEIEPQVDASGNIRAVISTEVSNIDGSVSTTFGPALLTRKTSTEFNVRSGETIVLSGLIQREQSTNVDKVPGLGDIPVIGALFRSKKFLNKETELVVFVTPSVISADSESNVRRVEQVERRIESHLGPAPHISRNDPEVTKIVPSVAPEMSPPSEAPASKPVPKPAAQPVVQSDSAAPAQKEAVKAVSFPRPQGAALRVKLDGLVVRAEPSTSGRILTQLGWGSVVSMGDAAPQPPGAAYWVPVHVGDIQGWVARQWVEPTRLELRVRPYGGEPAAQPSAAKAASAIATPADTVLADPLTLQGIAHKGSAVVLARRIPLLLTADVNAPVRGWLTEGQIVLALDIPSKGEWSAVEAGGMRGWVSTPWLQPVRTQQP